MRARATATPTVSEECRISADDVALDAALVADVDASEALVVAVDACVVAVVAEVEAPLALEAAAVADVAAAFLDTKAAASAVSSSTPYPFVLWCDSNGHWYCLSPNATEQNLLR